MKDFKINSKIKGEVASYEQISETIGLNRYLQLNKKALSNKYINIFQNNSMELIFIFQ